MSEYGQLFSDPLLVKGAVLQSEHHEKLAIFFNFAGQQSGSIKLTLFHPCTISILLDSVAVI